MHLARTEYSPDEAKLTEILSACTDKERVLKRILNPHLGFGTYLIDHVLTRQGFASNEKVDKDCDLSKLMPRLKLALDEATTIMEDAKKTPPKGYIMLKHEYKTKEDKLAKNDNYTPVNVAFQPMIFAGQEDQPRKEFETFNAAVDEYFSTLESQKLDLKVIQQEAKAMKKLENIKKDHDQRLIGLEMTQNVDKHRAELITRNQTLVDNAILSVRMAIANQFSWEDIDALVKDAQARGDPIASCIKQLKLETNHITLLLSDTYDEDNEGEAELKPQVIDVDLALSAFANAGKYYTKKRSAASKHKKTIESQGKALKSAEKKTKQALKEVHMIHTINKARKVYWFEKFYWFITSENYLGITRFTFLKCFAAITFVFCVYIVIGGRDQQQNELIVKRYLRSGDIYVHADLTGASSVVIKNPSGEAVPPKSLAEAGTMAVCYR